MTQAKDGLPVNADQVASLVKKLEQWGTTLPAQERHVLEYMLERIEGVVVNDAPAVKGGTTVAYLTETVMSAPTEQLGRPKAWVRGGPAWIRSA